MNAHYEHNVRVLRDREDYSDRHIRSLSYMHKQATSEGSLGRRPAGWLETIIYLGYGIGLADDRDRIVGFSVVRPMGVDENNDLVAYGECSLWRNDDYWEDVRYALIDASKACDAKHLWGAFFKTNHVANEFFEEYKRMSRGDAPFCIQRELGHYREADIEYICLTI